MSHYKHSIDLALLAKLKHEDLEREADRYRLAELACASSSIWSSISRCVAKLRQQLGRIRAKQPTLDGHDVMWVGVEARVGEIEEFLTGTREAHPMDRVLASILIMDVEQSTEHLVRRGDAAWRDTLDQLRGIAHRHIATFRGRSVNMIGDQIMAAFGGPIRAIRCAEAIQRDAEVLGLRLRAGVHAGEVEPSRDDPRGIAVHIAARIAALARGNEIVVSATVRDIVAGSGLSFADRGEQALKDVPDPRRVFSVAQGSPYD